MKNYRLVLDDDDDDKDALPPYYYSRVVEYERSSIHTLAVRPITPSSI